MKKNYLFILASIFMIIYTTDTPVVAAPAFKFPRLIDFNIIKNNKPAGHCLLVCTENFGRKGYNRELSTLKFINFPGFGLSSKQQLHTGIFRKDLALFIESITKGKTVVSQVRVQEGKHKDGKEGLIYIYRRIKPRRERQQEIRNQYQVINLLSSLLVASQRVAAGTHQTKESFNWVNNENIKIVDMVYHGSETAPFQGKHVPVEVIILQEPGSKPKEMLRINIFKDKQDNCFPISLSFTGKKQGTIKLNINKILKSPTFWGGNPLFVVQLPFMDAVEQTITPQSDVANFILGPVLNAFNNELTAAAQRWGKTLKINAKNHTLPLSEEQVKHLVLNALNPDLTEEDKVKGISENVMQKPNIDAIVTGQYIERTADGEVIIRPIVIFKDAKQVITEKWEFKTGELMCLSKTKNADGTGQKALCREVRDKITQLFKGDWQDITGAQKVKTTIASVPPPPQVTPTLTPLYAAHLGFMDANAKTIGGSEQETRLILKAFANVLTKELAQIEKNRNHQLILNDKTHTIPGTPQSIDEIISQAFDPLLSKDEKIKYIIDNILLPHRVDGVVSGHFIFKTGSPMITIRPIVVFKFSKQILTENFQFKVSDLVCQGPGKKKILCQDALAKITAKIEPFLNRLHQK